MSSTGRSSSVFDWLSEHWERFSAAVAALAGGAVVYGTHRAELSHLKEEVKRLDGDVGGLGERLENLDTKWVSHQVSCATEMRGMILEIDRKIEAKLRRDEKIAADVSYLRGYLAKGVKNDD